MILLVLAGFPSIFIIVGSRPFLGGLSNRFPNGVLSGEPQIQIVTILLLVGIMAFQSLGIIMITVIGAEEDEATGEISEWTRQLT